MGTSPALAHLDTADEQWGYVHVRSEIVWEVADLLLELAATIDPYDDVPAGHASGAHFRQQGALIAYAAELKTAAATAADGDEGAQCRARLADLGDEERDTPPQPHSDNTDD